MLMAPQGIAAGDYQPYKVSTWDKIPDTVLGIPAKDPTGLWIGGYYGVMAIDREYGCRAECSNQLG